MICYFHFKTLLPIFFPPTLLRHAFVNTTNNTRAMSALNFLSSFTSFQFAHRNHIFVIKSHHEMNVGVSGDSSNVNFNQFEKLLNNKWESATISLLAPLDSPQKRLFKVITTSTFSSSENRQQKIINCGSFFLGLAATVSQHLSFLSSQLFIGERSALENKTS